jgi:hypothetical protein
MNLYYFFPHLLSNSGKIEYKGCEHNIVKHLRLTGKSAQKTHIVVTVANEITFSLVGGNAYVVWYLWSTVSLSNGCALRNVVHHSQSYLARRGKVYSRLRNYFCRGKAINITYSECGLVVALVIQHEKRGRRIILSSVACPSLPHFSPLAHKRHNFRGKICWA